jgi:hypothetical protein
MQTTMSPDTGERAAKERLRESAGEWFPTVREEVLDRIVKVAWERATAAALRTGQPLEPVAAANVRRFGARALAGD